MRVGLFRGTILWNVIKSGRTQRTLLRANYRSGSHEPTTGTRPDAAQSQHRNSQARARPRQPTGHPEQMVR